MSYLRTYTSNGTFQFFGIPFTIVSSLNRVGNFKVYFLFIDFLFLIDCYFLNPWFSVLAK